MKQIVSQLGAQTYSTLSESSFHRHRCQKKAVIQYTRLVPPRETLKCFPLAECLSAGLAEAHTEQCKQLISRNSILAHRLISPSGKAELSNSHSTCGNEIELLRADFNPLTKLCDIPHLPFLSQLISRLNLPSWEGATPALPCCWCWDFPPVPLSSPLS